MRLFNISEKLSKIEKKEYKRVLAIDIFKQIPKKFLIKEKMKD